MKRLKMPHYRKRGKIEIPLSPEEFEKGMKYGKFIKENHKGFAALLFYSGVRKTEALRAVKKQFSFVKGVIFFDVGKRLKHGKVTSTLRIPIEKPFAEYIWKSIEQVKKDNKRIWPYSKKTAYNIIARVWYYPHHLRLTRITDILEKKNIVAAKSWTGLTLQSLEYYVGLIEMKEIAETL